ncbi:MAG: hypothetical protein OEZ38_00025 [Gammaproteobacteria bacterium]|nr:hypothetical protein [Gammaproteobacteria bacterium]
MYKNKINIVLLIILCSPAAQVYASDLMMEADVIASTSFDDNVDYSTVGNTVSVYTVKPKLELAYESDEWKTTSTLYVSEKIYSERLQNQFDNYIDIGTAYKQDRGVYSVEASYYNQARRAEETNILGSSVEQVDSKTISVAPRYTYNINERAFMSIAYALNSVDFGANTVGRFFSYDTHTAVGSLGYKLSQRSNLNLNLSAQDYASDNGASEYQVMSTNLEYGYAVTQIMTAKLSVGSNNFKFENKSTQSFPYFGSLVTGVTALETTSSGASYHAGIDAGWLTLGVGRNYVSSSVGGLQQSDSVDAKLRMQATPLIGLTLSIIRDEREEKNVYVSSYSDTRTEITPEMIVSLAHNLQVRAKYTTGEKEIFSSSINRSIDYKRFYVDIRYVFPSI